MKTATLYKKWHTIAHKKRIRPIKSPMRIKRNVVVLQYRFTVLRTFRHFGVSIILAKIGENCLKYCKT